MLGAAVVAVMSQVAVFGLEWFSVSLEVFMNKASFHAVEDAGETELAEMIRRAGEEARRKKQLALSMHFQRIRQVVQAARLVRVK